MNPSTPIPDNRQLDELLLTVGEAAKRLRTSQWMIYKLIRENRLMTIKIGSRRLVPSADLDAYVNARRSDQVGGRNV